MAGKKSADDLVKKPAEVVTYWLDEISASKKREKDWRKDGQRIYEIYGGEKSATTPFNILYSNTETLLPALYSAVPRPIVQRRFKDDDPLGKQAAMAGQRVLEFLLDTNVEGYETFDEAMQAAVLDALLPGRGVTCIKYDAETGVLPSSDDSDEDDKKTDDDKATPYKISELACTDSKLWNRVFYGYAKKWSKVPWIAYEEHLDKKEATRLFGEEISGKIVYTTSDDDSDEYDKKTGDDKNQGDRKTALVYQIWDKDDGRKIRYISPAYLDGYLKVDDDPLELTGFFNQPKPLSFLKKNDIAPVAIYNLYENQAKELNQLTLRISRIVKAIKARGVYDAELGDDIAKLFEADDNEMLPADKSSSLAAEKGLQNAIWFAPVEVLMTVLERLYQARENCKKVIYEITGIADIMRGASLASETLGAQKIKESWGTLRLKRLQKEVQRYARDILRMKLEIAATKFSEETWAKMTGLPFVTTQQRQQLESIAQAAQASGQPLDPQTQAQLSAPVWGQVLEMLRDDTQRSYRIDIETNSTVEPEAVEDQKNISDLLTALGQFLNGVGPLVAKGVMPFQVAQSMLLTITRRFRFGPEIEDQIKQMQPPKPEDNGEAAKSAQKDVQVLQDKMAMQAQLTQVQQKLQTTEAEKNLIERQTALDVREIKLNAEEQVFELKKSLAEKEIAVKVKGEHEKLDFKSKIETIKKSKEDTLNSKDIAAMQKMVQQLTDMNKQMITVVSQQAAESKEAVNSIIKAVIAPRRKKAIRDNNGRIAETVETIETIN